MDSRREATLRKYPMWLVMAVGLYFRGWTIADVKGERLDDGRRWHVSWEWAPQRLTMEVWVVVDGELTRTHDIEVYSRMGWRLLARLAWLWFRSTKAKRWTVS